MTKREYDGDPLDITWQDFQDRPYGGKGETVSVTKSEDESAIRTEGVGDAIEKLSQDAKFDDIDSWIEKVRNWDFDWREDLACDDSLPTLIRTCIFASIMRDMNKYNAQVDMDKWAYYGHDLPIEYRRLMGLVPFHERQYVGDPAMHEQYREYITEVLPEQAPDPLNNPVQ